MKLRHFLVVIFFILALTPVLLFRAWPHSAIIEKEPQGAQQRHLLLAQNIAASHKHYHRDIHHLADDLHSNEFADQVDMSFQPIYRTADMSFVGVEGLIRWHYPKEGLLEPKDFLSVVSALGDSSQIASIVKSIINLAHNFGVEVVGKGVENMKQLSLLRELGCDYVQGYALNKPMTREELTVSLSQPKAAQT